MSPKRLVLLVEGPGDVEAAPILVKRLLKEYAAFDAVLLDQLPPFRVGDYSKIKKNDFGEWRRLLQAAVTTRKDVGGCVLLLDGDSPIQVEGKSFCAARAARILAAEAMKVGAGAVFSLAIVFACMEFESWLIAGIESLQDCRLANDRQGIKKMTIPVPPDLEKAPRGAKEWLRNVMTMGYDPTRDQAELTRLVDLNVVRNRNQRSFQHLESAIKQMVAAIRSGNHVVAPTC
jgi:hypothetical protein